MTHITCAFMPHDIQDCLCFGQISIQKISFFSRYGSKFPTSQLSAEEIAPGHLFITPSKHEAFEGMPYKADMPIKAYALVQVLAPKATMPNQVFERHWVCVCLISKTHLENWLVCDWWRQKSGRAPGFTHLLAWAKSTVGINCRQNWQSVFWRSWLDDNIHGEFLDKNSYRRILEHERVAHAFCLQN